VCTDGKVSWVKVTWDQEARMFCIVCATVDDWRLIFAAFQKHFDTTPNEFDEDKWSWLEEDEDDVTVDEDGYVLGERSSLSTTGTFAAVSVIEMQGRGTCHFHRSARPETTALRNESGV
jgi:hypothetical protein